jgi:hypothetical protein
LTPIHAALAGKYSCFLWASGVYIVWNKKITAPETERLLDAWLLSNVNTSDIVLDLGSGTGRYLAMS